MSRALVTILAADDNPIDVPSNYMSDVRVEIAWTSSYSTPAASRVWTDVSQWVELTEQITVRVGRGDELSTAEPNSCTLALDNTDGRFTAGLSTSPYYPNVKIGRPIRVSLMTASGHTSVRFVGYVEEWPVEWTEGTDSYAAARVTAISRTARLGLSVELKSIIEEEILVDDPVVYYTLGEAAGATTAADSSGSTQPATLAQVGSGTAVVFGNATGPGTDGLTAATFASGKYLTSTLGTYPAVTDSFTVEVFFSTSGTGAILLKAGDLNLQVDLTGKLFVLVGSATVQSTSTVNDGATHHGAAVCTVTGSNITRVDLYVDGVVTGTSWTGSDANTTRPTFQVGNSDLTGVLAHAALGATALSSTRILAHANAGLNGFAGETPAARLTRYASYAGVAATELSFETGKVLDLAHLDTTGVTALEMMRKVEATEEGVLFDARDGTLTFHDRSHRYSPAFGFGGGSYGSGTYGGYSAFALDASAGQVEASYAPKLDRSAMLNDVTATSTDGKIAARAVAQTSIDTYGVARSSLDVATTNAEEPFQHASWIVGQYGEPGVRAPQLGVEIAHLSQTLQASVLDATVGTRFTVTGLPSQSDATSKEFIVEGYTETIGPETHRIEFNVSPAAPWDVWTVEDAVLGQYDAYPIAL